MNSKKNIEFVGKCLVVGGEILVIGDLHLGYVEALRRSGIHLPAKLFEVVEKDLLEILSRTGKMKKIILLGDVKHAIGSILGEERKDFRKLFNLLSQYSTEIVLIKGNHDVLLQPILEEYSIKLVDFYTYDGIAFVHGNKDFPELHSKDVGLWVMGHAHPAVTLREGVKFETYKCFLSGKYKSKNIIIVPSFFPFVEGTDPRSREFNLPWEFNLNSFNVNIVGEGLEVLEFGKLKTIKED